MLIPTKDAFCEMTPEEFERVSLKILNEQMKGVDNLKIEHDVIFKKEDGNYQIDGTMYFEIMGMKYLTLVECKRYKSAITREIVQLLYDKIRAIGAQKGVIISTSNFQKGALEFAKVHGIALIQLTEADTKYETRSRMNVIMLSAGNAYNYGEKYVGTLQRKLEMGGISCKYLIKGTSFLREFLEEKNDN